VVPASVHYHVLFDAARAGFDAWGTLVAASAFACLLILGGIWPQRVSEVASYLLNREVPSPEMRALGIGIGGGGLLLFLSLAGLDYSRLRNLRFALEQRRYVTVEGMVTDFVQGDSARNVPESFEVEGRRYVFRNGAVTDGYKGTFSRRPDIRNGVMVRIADVHGIVARLEVSDTSPFRLP